MSEVSDRLRELRELNNWTVADMAERTGIPKRTLDKYMLRQGASLPGLEALCALSRGLGVSLDWLVFGTEMASENLELMVDRSAHYAVKLMADILLRHHREGRQDVVTDDYLSGMSPEEWAADLGYRAAEKAKLLLAQGVTKEELLTWREKRGERIMELIRGRFDAMAAAEESEAVRGNGN